MKKVLLTAVAAIFAVMFLATPAKADVFTMTTSQLLELYETYENPDGLTQLFTSYEALGGVAFSGQIRRDTPGWAQIQIGANYWGIPWGGAAGDESSNMDLGMSSFDGYHGYSLTLLNNNENAWMYNLYANVGYTDAPASEDDWYFQSAWTSIDAGATATLTMDFTHVEAWKNGVYQGFVNAETLGINPDHISNIGFTIGGNVPLDGYDYVFETIVYPVPEPASLSLLGLSLIGLAGIRRKKRS